MNPTRMICVAFALFTAVGGAASAQAEEGSFVVDPNTGDYHIQYRSYDGTWVDVTYVPATKVRPIVVSHLEAEHGGAIHYRYKVTNGPGSKQPIAVISLHVSSVEGRNPIHLKPPAPPGMPSGIYRMKLESPPGWNGKMTAINGTSGVVGGWMRDPFKQRNTPSLAPGRSLSGFGYESRDLPGVGEVRFMGDTPIQGFPDNGPDPNTPVGKEFAKREDHDFVARFAAIPKIPVADPFDPAFVVTGIQKHLNQDLVSLNLVDPVFASQLNRGLQAAVDAAKLNNIKTMKGNLRDVRRLLKKEYPDADKGEAEDDRGEDGNRRAHGARLIAPLAAQVLDFDVRYVEARVRRDGDD